MGDYNPDLAKQKHNDMQALNHAKFKMEYHRFCMITWENCLKYACEIVDMQGIPFQENQEREDPAFEEVCRVSEKLFDFIEQKADEMYDSRFRQLEREAKGEKPNNFNLKMGQEREQ